MQLPMSAMRPLSLVWPTRVALAVKEVALTFSVAGPGLEFPDSAELEAKGVTALPMSVQSLGKSSIGTVKP